MKYNKLILCLILSVFLIELASATIYNESNAYSYSDDTLSGYAGENIRTGNSSLIVYNVSVVSASDVSYMQLLYYTNQTLLANGSLLSGGVSTFASNPVLAPDTNYSVVGVGDGSWHQYISNPATTPKVGVTLNWTSANNNGNPLGALGFLVKSLYVETTVASPSVSLISPADTITVLDNTNFFVANVTQAVGDPILNVSLYINGTLNQTNTSGLSGVYYNFSVDLPFGLWNWSVVAYSTGINKGQSGTRTITVARSIFLSNTYNPFVLEQSTQKFYTNFTIASGLSVSAVNITYNQTTYQASFVSINASSYNATATLTTPYVTATQNKTFNWTVYFTDGSSITSSNNQQEVQDFGIDSCGSNTIMILNFTMRDEDTLGNMSNIGVNTSINLNLQLYPNASKSVATFNFSNVYTKINPARVCISSALGSTVFFMDTQVQYGADSYSTEYYNIQNYSLNATNNPNQNVSLYDLATNRTQVFTITYKDSSFLSVPGTLIQVQRKYVGEDLFRVVEAPVTDIAGQTVVHLVTNDVVYSFTVVKNGLVLATFLSQNAICQTPLISDCRIDLNSFASSISVVNFTQAKDFSYTLTYDNATRTISSVFSIPSNAVSVINLTVTSEDALSTFVCTDQVTTSAGTVSCVVPANFGDGIVRATLYKDGGVIAFGQINLAQKPSQRFSGAFVVLALLTFLTVIGAMITDSPMIALGVMSLGLIMMIALNIVGNTGFIGGGATVLFIIIAIIIVAVKGGKRN